MDWLLKYGWIFAIISALIGCGIFLFLMWVIIKLLQHFSVI